MDLHHSTDICYVTLLFSLCICVCVFVFVYLCNCIFILRLVHFASRWNGGAAPLDCHGRVNQHLLQAALFFWNIITANTTCIPRQKNPDTVAIWTNTWTTYRDYLLVPRLGKCRKQDSVYKWILILRFDCHRTDSLLTIDKIAIYYKDTKIIARLTMLKSTRKRKEMQEKWIIFDLFLRKVSHKVDGIFLRGTIGSIS